MQLTKEAILDAIPVDCRDGLIEVREPDGSFGKRGWYVVYAPGSMDEIVDAAKAVAEKLPGVRATPAGGSSGPEFLIVVNPTEAIR